MPSASGNLPWKPLPDGLDLVAPPVAEAVGAGAMATSQVAPIDDTLADTEAFCEAYDVDPAHAANCVVVEGRRGDDRTRAAVIVLAPDRADVNKTVRKHLGVRKISFADQTNTEIATGMTSGGITPVGLPADWPILIDESVLAAGRVVIGGGVRSSKILATGHELAELPGAEVLALRLE